MPLAEQRRIVAQVDPLMALVDTLETQLAASRATAGQLVQRDPNDEPASRLPKRVQENAPYADP